MSKRSSRADSVTRANTSPAMIATSATVTVGLHDHGVISDAGYERGKDKILSRPAA